MIGGAGIGSAAAEPDKNVPAATESTADGATPEMIAPMKTQNALHEVADRIEAMPTDGSSGMSNIVVDAKHNALRLYWKGTQPDGVPAEIAAAARESLKATIASSMPVELVEQPEAVVSLGRYDDAAPFWGGGYLDRYLISVGYVMCTNGFAVTGNNAASDYLLTGRPGVQPVRCHRGRTRHDHGHASRVR